MIGLRAGFVGLAIVALCVSLMSWAEDSGNPAIANLSGAPLVVWTQTQNPQPIPQAESPNVTPDPQPETPAPTAQTSSQAPQTGGSADQGHAEGAASDATAQTFTGTVSKEGDGYVLKVQGPTAYQLDDQDKAKEFDGQKVRVVGTLARDSNMIHVQKIEPLT